MNKSLYKNTINEILPGIVLGVIIAVLSYYIIYNILWP